MSTAAQPARAAQIAVRVRAATKIYPNGVHALAPIDLEVREGEFLTLLGPSGCGKSTLLRLAAGLQRPTAGEFTVWGQPPAGARQQGRLSLVFQDPTLLPWKSVLDNVLFPIRILRRPLADYRARALDLLDMVGLAEFRDKRPHELSGGMRQRAAICRALIHDPQLLLMDEPFSALDAITRDEMNVALLDIWERHHKTALFVTHSIREAVFLSDRVLVMNRRPATIIGDVAIGLPRPRDLSIGETPAFNELCGALREMVGLGHAGSATTARSA